MRLSFSLTAITPHKYLPLEQCLKSGFRPRQRFWKDVVLVMRLGKLDRCLKLKVAEIYTGNLTWENEGDAPILTRSVSAIDGRRRRVRRPV